MNTPRLHTLPPRAALAALLLLAGTTVSWAQQAQEQPAEGQAAHEHAEETSAAADSARPSPFPPAELSEEELEVMVAAAAHLFPLLPHEPGGQPGSAVEGFALLGSAVDSLDGRGKVALSEEHAWRLVDELTARAVRARYCGSDCGASYGEAALTFHVPRIEGDEATVWVLTFWAIGQLPNKPPDRILQRGDEIRLEREDGRWTLKEHTKLREELKFVLTPGYVPKAE